MKTTPRYLRIHFAEIFMAKLVASEAFKEQYVVENQYSGVQPNGLHPLGNWTPERWIMLRC